MKLNLPREAHLTGAASCYSSGIARSLATASGSLVAPALRHRNALRTSYVARAVDLSGVGQATYEFDALDDEAKRRAAEFLEAHPTVELWKGVQHIASLTREKAEDG